jgi:hypothetical protein
MLLCRRRRRSARSPLKELEMKHGQYEKCRSDFAYGFVLVAMFVVTTVGVAVGVFGGGEQAALQAMQARMGLPVPGPAPATQVAGERTEPRT